MAKLCGLCIIGLIVLSTIEVFLSTYAWDAVKVEQLYKDFSETLEKNVQLKTDMHEIQPKVGQQNLTRYLKTRTEANVLLLTVSYDLMVFN